MSMMKKHKLLPAHHTGKVRHHRHTSYGALAILLLLTVLPLVAMSRSVAIAASDPMTADNTVYAVVPGTTPTVAPTIGNIAQNTVYTQDTPVTVTGTCPDGTLVKVYKNDVFSGATLCQNGRFSVQIDLFLESNTLVVRAFTATNATGPESAPVVVRKELSGSGASVAKQFFITSDIYYKGVGVGDTLLWPLVIAGGQAPYAVSISWGDGKTDLISRGTDGPFDIQHTYQKPGEGYKGSYRVTISITDAAGNKSFIHLVSIVGGAQPSIAQSVKQGYQWSGTVRIAWQLISVSALLVLAFWLGERREMRILKGTGVR